MDDQTLIHRIDSLAQEEHTLFQRESTGEATYDDKERLKKLQLMLDQCWDLLRQRRAKQEFGLNPDEAHMRDASTVEGYSG